MMNRRLLLSGCLAVCAILATATLLRSADDPNAAPPDPNQPAEVKTVTQIYDIRALVTPSVDSGLANSPHSDAFVVPAARQGNTYDYGSGAGLFEGEPGRPGPTIAERRGQLIGVITATIAPASWQENGGIGSIHDLHGMLVIKQTPSNQKAIAALLDELTRSRFQSVRITADWLLLSPDEVAKLLKTSAGIDPHHAAMRVIDPADLKRLSTSARHFHADLLAHNGQTVHFISGREQTVTFNQTASVGTEVSGWTPVHANVGDGIALEATAVVDRDDDSALVTLFSTFNDGLEVGPPIALRSTATTQASTGERVVTSEASASYHELSDTVQEFRSTARMPLGAAVMIGAMTLEPSMKNAAAQQLVLIVKIQSEE